MFSRNSWFLVLCLALAALTACGTRRPVEDRPDVQSEPMADAAMPADQTTPPPGDVVVTMRDADGGSPSDVVVSPSDVPVAEDRVAPPPADVVADASTIEERTMMVVDGGMSFNPVVCEVFQRRGVRVRGSTIPAERPACTMQPDGTATLRISTSLSNELNCGYTRAVCAQRSCDFPDSMTTDGCTWLNLLPEMENFISRDADGNETIVELMP